VGRKQRGRNTQCAFALMIRLYALYIQQHRRKTMEWFDKLLDKFFGFDKLATKDDVKKCLDALERFNRELKERKP
jgi:hypothetical protein